MADFIDAQGFRANVGIVLIRDGGEVFLGSRSDGRGWQFPQGGVQRDESPEQALFRELPTLHGVVPFAHGCNMGFRRSVLEQTGGFDETYLIGCDIEMAIRLWRADVTLMWSPEALVHYRLRSTPRAVYRQARAYGRSRLRFDALVPELEPTHGATKQLRRLAWLMRHLPDLRSLEGRFKWSWVSGQVVGEVEGLLRRQQP